MAQLRVATRRSHLARTQTQWVIDQLREVNPKIDINIVEVTSSGDRDLATPITSLPIQGAFTKALQDALVSGRADIAVHSLKDLPTTEPDGLIIAAIPQRQNPSDVLVTTTGAGLMDLPPSATIGTGSPRRLWQLAERRTDLCPVELRGNIDTRLDRVARGDLDAAILAAAGLYRIGRKDAIAEELDFIPAPGQGALAVECRARDADIASMLGAIHDSEAGDAVAAERAWLAATGAGCRSSAAALAVITQNGQLMLQWLFDGLGGSALGERSDPVQFGSKIGQETLACRKSQS